MICTLCYYGWLGWVGWVRTCEYGIRMQECARAAHVVCDSLLRVLPATVNSGAVWANCRFIRRWANSIRVLCVTVFIPALFMTACGAPESSCIIPAPFGCTLVRLDSMTKSTTPCPADRVALARFVNASIAGFEHV